MDFGPLPETQEADLSFTAASTVLPRGRISSAVHYGQHKNGVSQQSIVHKVREAMKAG